MKHINCSLATEVNRLLLNEREAARRLNVSPRTLFSMRMAGKIPFIRMGTNLVRYSESSLIEWITQNKVVLKKGE